MISLLQSIVDVFISIVTLIGNMISSLINLLAHIPTYVNFLVTSISFLPSQLVPFATASISIYVIFLLLNRGSAS